MKRYWKMAISCILTASLAALGCAGEVEPPKGEKNLAPAEMILPYAQYSAETYLKPFWYTREIYHETVMFVGEDDEARLLYDADEILSVLNYGLNVSYEEGSDWTYRNGIFKRTVSSAIPYWQLDEYYRTEPDAYTIGVDKSKLTVSLEGDRYLKYGEQDTFTKKQIAVTYTHSEPWEGPVPAGKSDRLPNALAKIKGGETVNLLFYGDSISTGCNASGTAQGGNVSPFAPSFPEMVCTYLKERYRADVICENTAVGGKNTAWGQQNLDSAVIAHEPDLVVIGFGMNDRATAVETYSAGIEDMIVRIRRALPSAEIVLLATMLPNYEADANWFGNQESFASALLALEAAYPFVAVANVTEMHRALFEAGKRYRDVTGNNINHPNDFVVRLYAQVILKTMLGADFCDEIYTDR